MSLRNFKINIHIKLNEHNDIARILLIILIITRILLIILIIARQNPKRIEIPTL